MEFVKTIRVRLEGEEEKAIGKVLDILDSMWEQNEDYEMEELWERYGSNEDGWTCIGDTLRNLLNGGRTV
jgi:hypothetical protein